jgi:hypothetical protein
VDWPGNPIAQIWLVEGQGQIFQVSQGPTVAMIEDSHVTFTAECFFVPQSASSTDNANFYMGVYQQVNGAWTLLEQPAVTATVSNMSPILTADIPFTTGDMQLQFVFTCYDDSFGPENATLSLEAQRGPVDLGSFGLDFVPASIIYCPPGQDMTASLTQSESYGTQFTIGQSETLKSSSGFQISVGASGILGIGIGASDSQSITNKSTTGMQISHFRNTIVTADNQRAIGRAYWGPLGDIFVVLLNPQFKLTQNFDGSIAYQMMDAGDVVLLPAWKLLRPLADPIASAIPADVRQRLLSLDPFIANLDLFFPDSGADLAQAANPAADPTANERAELIGSWWPDNGVELNYTFGETQQLQSTTTQEIDLDSTVTLNLSGGADTGDIEAALSMTSSGTTSVGYQTSKETTQGSSVSASCLLIRNQNDRDLDGIEVYYDRVFSTLMFRRILADPQHRRITGNILDIDGKPMSRMLVAIQGGDNYYAETYTDASGQYRLSNIPLGEYTLLAGDSTLSVSIAEGSWVDPIRLDISEVAQLIDLARCSVGGLANALGLDLPTVRKMISAGVDFRNLEGLAGFAGIDRHQLDAWRDTIHFASPSPPAGTEQP